MKAYVFLYDDFADFEITLALYVLQHKYEIISISLDKNPKFSHGKLKHVIDETINDVDISQNDVLLIPGGNPEPYKENSSLNTFLKNVNDKGVFIAAICGGPGFLAHADILKGKKVTHGYSKEEGEKVFADAIITEDDVVLDGNILSAKGWAYAEFAIEIGRYLNMFEDNKEANRLLQVFKNQKPN